MCRAVQFHSRGVWLSHILFTGRMTVKCSVKIPLHWARVDMLYVSAITVAGYVTEKISLNSLHSTIFMGSQKWGTEPQGNHDLLKLHVSVPWRRRGLLQQLFVLHLKKIWPFKAQWLRYVPPSLTLKPPHFLHTVHLWVSYDSQNKQLLFL
jgi:hypothetical protein